MGGIFPRSQENALTIDDGFKKIIKNIRTAALLLSAVLLLNGCAATEELPFIPLGEENERVSEYRVIISREASGELISRASKLCFEIKKQTGVDALLFYDDETLISKEDTHEVVVGNTMRIASRVLLKGLRRDDYICTVSGERTVIGGRSDSATVSALDRFLRELLPMATEQRLLNEGGGFSFRGSYDIEWVSLDGVELSEYSLEVLDYSDGAALNTAYSLKRAISEKTGYVLDVITGRAEGRKISLDIQSGLNPEIAYIEKNEMGITVTAGEARGLGYGAEYLCEVLCKGGEVAFPERVSVPYSDASLKIGSACLSSLLPFGGPQSIALALEAINGEDAEIMLCGKLEDSDLDRLLLTVNGRELIDGCEAVVFESDGQPAAVTSAESYRQSGVTVERLKIETPRLKILLHYIYGNAEDDVSISLDTEDGYALAAMVHTEGGKVSLTDGKGKALNPLIKSDGVSCYADESELDVTVVGSGELYGVFEFFAR